LDVLFFKASPAPSIFIGRQGAAESIGWRRAFFLARRSALNPR
jgi:hypothetical protein